MEHIIHTYVIPTLQLLQEEDVFEVRNTHHPGLSKRDAWDDEFILKRQFSALIPAFDPRPGRTNVNQTSDIEVPPPDDACDSGSSSQVIVSETPVDLHQPPKIHLTLKGPNLPGKTPSSYVFHQELEFSLKARTLMKCLTYLLLFSCRNSRCSGGPE